VSLAEVVVIGAAVALIGVTMSKTANQITVDKAMVREIVDRVNAEQGGWHDPRDVMAIIEQESRFNPRAVGTSGELGLMQLMPSTAADMGYVGALDGLFDPETNIRLGMRYLIWVWNFLSARLGREPTISEWLGGYNAGVGNVLNGTWRQGYVNEVVARLKNYG
jgi:soluble lytic murein transglycosylase-like protein